MVGRLGRFAIVKSEDQVAWLPSATEEDKARIKGVITPIRYLGRRGSGQHVLSMHVMFKNALFRTNCNIESSRVTELDKEDLVLERQPFMNGPDFDLTIYR